ncbi:hypothetical protein COV42_01565 [Candidatus Campbellbacteria bacterium CG11_big_fil_rev_8_21_14_0_20_44_21]|uniref:Uncharacterized protein n=1 Tax=Candidatus Campbellbacteria bacterium CG22_combo_CG10-13_8_21_14_all_43_18 TaxID=1974530 RepID=A0A2H0DXM0_9BACT|nr:MAG: hypothetical protein COW82_01965 [Candidatus Campbellbacteria bacterium CG22_combo_CG10-13_8_21_14_all_43_18]PIR24281.1 MAG: hypothetical protein COV42_01565 [Candidatus Campbellbacteria bacterium CG11_big_fil_rev_8_21_14_0_20_44_21]
MNEENTNINEETTEGGATNNGAAIRTRAPRDEKGAGVGPIAGAIIVIIIIVLGGLYFIGKRAGEIDTTEGVSEEVAPEDAAVLELEKQDNSDELEAIESDLEATNLENLDEEIENIDTELNF